MAEKLTDQDLKDIIVVFNELSKLYKDKGKSLHGLTKSERELRDKIVRIITKQPDPIPYCNCPIPDFNHEFTKPYCRKCYGVPHNWKP